MADVNFGGGVSPVKQEGPITPGGVAVWLDEGILVDGSGPSGVVTEAPLTGGPFARQGGLWVPVTGGGGVTAITAGHGLSGGTITGAGTIALQTPVSLADGGLGVAAASPAAALTALGGAPLNSPALTGAPTLVTAPPATDDSSRLATTAWVTAKIAATPAGVSQITATTPISASAATGNVALTLTTVPVSLGGTGETTAAAALGALGGAPLASPGLTGVPTAPTAVDGTNTTQLATTAFVQSAIGGFSALPTGGAQYDVLSKASATAGDVEWRGAGVRPNNNTVIGAGARAGVTTGFNSVAIGTNALASATTGNFSVAVGMDALMSNPLSTQNTAVGYYALRAFTNNGVGGGSGNTACGANALAGLVSGTRNTALGSTAGGAVAVADNSIFIGMDALPAASGQFNQIVIGTTSASGGAEARGNGSNTITLGNADMLALYTRAGLVLGNAPTGGAQGVGTINLTGDIYKDGQPLGFAQTAGWVAGTDPSGAILYVNNTGRTLTILSVVGQREVQNTTSAVINVRSAAANVSIASGTLVSVVNSFDAGDPAPGQTVNMTSGALLLAPGERLGLVANPGAAFDDSVASISVYLA